MSTTQNIHFHQLHECVYFGKISLLFGVSNSFGGMEMCHQKLLGLIRNFSMI